MTDVTVTATRLEDRFVGAHRGHRLAVVAVLALAGGCVVGHAERSSSARERGLVGTFFGGTGFRSETLELNPGGRFARTVRNDLGRFDVTSGTWSVYGDSLVIVADTEGATPRTSRSMTILAEDGEWVLDPGAGPLGLLRSEGDDESSW